ncbi:MAG: hypothetical protein HC800_04370 [Phormidesmis sp. RL_2_1]|nr:hypothetical protein [Phormidesmis sp. RL_2_1]
MTAPSPLPTEAEHFKGRYQPWLGLAFFLLGATTTTLNLWAMLLSGELKGAIVVGALLTIIGVLYLNRPYFALAPNRLTIYNLIGSAVNRYSFESFSQIKIENGSVLIDSSYPNEPPQKVKITPWMVRSADWKRLKAIASVHTSANTSVNT